MFNSNLRKLSLRVSAVMILVALVLTLGQNGAASDPTPGDCDLDRQGCINFCIDPVTGLPDEVCALQCRNAHTNCENSAFGANLSPENFSIPVSIGCSTFYDHYSAMCLNGGTLLPRHQPVYAACIADGFSALDCCRNVAEDFVVGLIACNE
jgi:hypothetical protein